MNKQISLKKNIFLNSLKTFLSLCFPLITFPYSSRILGPENLGKVNFAQSIISYFAIIASLGISTYATREAAKVRDNKCKLNQLCKEILIINTISTIISYVLLAISFLFIKKFNNYRELIIICSSLIMFTTIGMGWLYQAMEDYFYIAIRSIIFQIISIILLFILVKSKDDYLWYAAINIISNVGANIFNFIHSRKYISLKTSHHVEIKKHLKSIFILFASAIATTIFSSIDITMLGFLSSNQEVGFYAAGLKIIKMIQHLFPAIAIVIFPRVSYYLAQKDQEKVIELSKNTLNFLICFALPMTVGIFLLINPLVNLFCGASYQASVPVSKIMSPHIIITAISGFIGGTLLISYGKEKKYLISIISAAIIDILLNFLLIPKFLAFGAATATLITEIYLLIFYLIIMSKFLKKIKIAKHILEYIISTIFMGIIILFIKNLFSNNFVQLILSFTIGIIVYFTLLFLMKNSFIKEQFFTIINKIRNKK